MRHSDKTQRELAEERGVGIGTLRKWQRRESTEDRSHISPPLQTTLSQAQEVVVVELRKSLKLPLDDLLSVTRAFINDQVSRAGLDRCLRRYGISCLSDIEPASGLTAKPHKAFKAYQPGFIHLDVKSLPQMPDETSRKYLFVAIDRASRWVFAQILPRKTAACAERFLKALAKAAPFKIYALLTDNGSEFTDRLFNKQKQASGEHEFDRLCTALGIEHRLTKPRHLQTNSMAERFNGRISEVLATHRFDSALDLAQTLERYLWLYNHPLPQKALAHEPPVQTLKRWQAKHPELFVKRVTNRPGCDNYRAAKAIRLQI
ncbi:IS481 family transposase [Crenobacter cavernae]|uniref:IS481 family transposase n=1 Tax=Crenobacter cavernae TaxID=2290923 RepID=A0ABY0F956_9NEIS|nr:IS481 family transposase [Crenobacter cavernae]RXZ42003.1 IS481 family transposase [Crenobacter cavernae]